MRDEVNPAGTVMSLIGFCVLTAFAVIGVFYTFGLIQ